MKLIDVNEVAKILNVHQSTTFGYVERGLIPAHALRIKLKGNKVSTKFWVESEILMCVDAVEAQKGNKAHHQKIAKTLASKPKPVKTASAGYSLAMGLMGARK